MLCLYRTREVGNIYLGFNRMLELLRAFHLVSKADVGLKSLMDPASILMSVPTSLILTLDQLTLHIVCEGGEYLAPD